MVIVLVSTIFNSEVFLLKNVSSYSNFFSKILAYIRHI